MKIKKEHIESMKKRGKKSAQKFISQEISHLIKDKGYKQDRAIAAAYAVARKKGFNVK